MAIGEKSKTDPNIISELGTKSVCVNVTLVRKTDDPDQKLLFWLTRVPQEKCAEEAERLGYVFVSVLGPLDVVAGGSTNAKGLSLMTLGNDQMMIMIENFLNATGGPMFTLGRQTGRSEGYQDGLEAGDAAGFERGKTVGRAEGDTAGYDRGHLDGYTSGHSTGMVAGVALLQRNLANLLTGSPQRIIKDSTLPDAVIDSPLEIGPLQEEQAK